MKKSIVASVNKANAKKTTTTAPVRKATKKKVTKKVTAKKVAKKVTKTTTPKITMTLSQAKTIQKALGTKSYSFLDKKVSAAHVGSIIL